MDDSLGDPHHSAKSRKRKVQDPAGVCGEVGHTRRTCRNPHVDFNSNYEGDVVPVEDLLDGSWVPGGESS